MRTSAPCGNLKSPTTINKLKALKDLDEMVGRSLNRLGLIEEGRKDGDGSETGKNSGEGEVINGFGKDEMLDISDVSNNLSSRRELKGVVHVTNGCRSKGVLDNGDVGGLTKQETDECLFKSEGSHLKSEGGKPVEIGNGDITMLQEDDVQLLLDDFTLGEAHDRVSEETVKEQGK